MQFYGLASLPLRALCVPPVRLFGTTAMLDIALILGAVVLWHQYAHGKEPWQSSIADQLVSFRVKRQLWGYETAFAFPSAPWASGRLGCPGRPPRSRGRSGERECRRWSGSCFWEGVSVPRWKSMGKNIQVDV